MDKPCNNCGATENNWAKYCSDCKQEFCYKCIDEHICHSPKDPEKECHCGKDGHALNSVNCPVYGYYIVPKDPELERVLRKFAEKYVFVPPPESHDSGRILLRPFEIKGSVAEIKSFITQVYKEAYEAGEIYGRGALTPLGLEEAKQEERERILKELPKEKHDDNGGDFRISMAWENGYNDCLNQVKKII